MNMKQLIEQISNDMTNNRHGDYNYKNCQYKVFTYPDNIDKPKKFYCYKVELQEDRSINGACLEIKDYIDKILSKHPKYDMPEFMQI